MNAVDQSVLKKKQSFVSIPGHLFGYKTSCMLVDVDFSKVEASQLHRVDAHLRKFLAEFQPMHANLIGEKVKHRDSLAGLIYWIYLCLRIASVPRVTVGRTMRAQARKIQRLVIPAPVRSHQAVFELIRFMMHVLDVRHVGKLEAEIAQNLPMAINRIRSGFNGGSNVPHFLAAAMQLNIPVEEISASIMQFGHGKKSRWLNSSFTDQTSQISAHIARNKQIAARVLRDAGLPVAMNAIAKNIEDAHQISKHLRYPVVVKPADRDGGVGVAANLLNREEVAAAYEEARKYSANVLVEKHIPGRDYRLTIFNGQLISAIERVPASVVGDGKHTVAELLNILNSDPRRGEGPHAVLKKVVLDDEAQRLLIASSLTHTSVPKLGKFVLLRSRANVSSGGVPVAVLDRVHPDNRRLAIRAAKAIGLDFAGIDFITPDIGCSWMENGGAICEINAQPQLGSITSPHIYSEILKRILPDGGRIPSPS